MKRDKLKQWIRNYEGCKLKPYVDTVGKLSIGIGRNLTDRGLSKTEVELLFDNDIDEVERQLLEFDWYVNSPSAIKDALFNMCFNLGINRLLDFKRMIKAIKEENYTIAAMEALNSQWAMQVPSRAKDIAAMIREA